MKKWLEESFNPMAPQAYNQFGARMQCSDESVDAFVADSSVVFGHGAVAAVVGKASKMLHGVNTVKDGQEATLELGDAVVHWKESSGYFGG